MKKHIGILATIAALGLFGCSDDDDGETTYTKANLCADGCKKFSDCNLLGETSQSDCESACNAATESDLVDFDTSCNPTNSAIKSCIDAIEAASCTDISGDVAIEECDLCNGNGGDDAGVDGGDEDGGSNDGGSNDGGSEDAGTDAAMEAA